jgi:hypothetical protein
VPVPVLVLKDVEGPTIIAAIAAAITAFFGIIPITFLAVVFGRLELLPAIIIFFFWLESVIVALWICSKKDLLCLT